MTDEELKIKESELKYAIGNLVDNLISYKRECDNQADRIAELEEENAELKKSKRECETSLCRAEYQYNYDQLTKAKEILKSLYFIIESRIDYKNNIEIADEMWRAEQFLSEVENV